MTVDGHLKEMEHLLDGKKFRSSDHTLMLLLTLCSSTTNGLGYNSSITDTNILVAPSNFIGDLTNSYSLQFLVQIQLSQVTSLLVNMSTVEICGPEEIECIVGQFELDRSRLESERIILLSVSSLYICIKQYCTLNTYLYCRFLSEKLTGGLRMVLVTNLPIWSFCTP